jgi:hypothetical protein
MINSQWNVEHCLLNIPFRIAAPIVKQMMKQPDL